MHATFQFKIGISITQKCDRFKLIIDPKGHRGQLPERERYPGKIRFLGSPRRFSECTGKRQMLASESDEATTCKWLAYLRFTFPRLAETRRVVNVFKNLQLLHDRKQVSPSRWVWMTNIDKIISIIIGFYFKSDPHSKFFTSSVTLNCIRLVSWTSKERTIEIWKKLKRKVQKFQTFRTRHPIILLFPFSCTGMQLLIVHLDVHQQVRRFTSPLVCQLEDSLSPWVCQLEGSQV